MKQKHTALTLIISLTLLLTSALAHPVMAAPGTQAPTQAYISGLVGHAQSMPLSCESRSAADLAQFWGLGVTETQFFNSLPKSDNPNKGFVGSVFGAWGQIPPYPYGVHAQPVANLLNQYGLTAQAHSGMSYENLKSEIAAGRPVIVWVIGGVWSGTAQNYTASDGETMLVAAYEHTMIMIGYDQSVVHLVDAGNGLKITSSVNNFLNSWGVLGNMAVTAQLDNQSSPEPNPAPNGGDPTTYVVKSGDYLAKIGNMFGVSWQDIAALNNIYYPYIIYPGQVLIINYNSPPATATVAPPTPTINAPTPTLANSPTATNPPKPTATTAPATATAPAVPTSTQASPPTATSGPTNLTTYTVLPGEHLMQIARKLSLDWLEIANINGLFPPYILYPGQVLKLPGSESTAPTPTTQPTSSGPTATKAPTSAVTATATPNNSPTSTPSGGGFNYTVQPGDYLVALERKFGVPWLDIAAANDIFYPYLIYPGQVLIIP